MTRATGETGSSRSIVWWGLLLLLALVALPLGANRPWAWSAMALWVALLLGGWAVALARGRTELLWRGALWPPALMVALVVGWIIASTIPGIGPANPVWQIASDQFGRSLPARVTISPDATLVALMRLLAYLSVFWLSLQYCRDRDRAEALIRWMCWIGLAYALYGLINYFSGNPYLLWFERWAGQFDVTATFVNRNHYATFAGLGMVCSAAVAIDTFRSAWRLSDRSQPKVSRTIECLAGRPLAYYLILLVIGMAWLQSHSRMGAVAGALGIIMLLALMMATRQIRRGLVTGIIALLAGFFLLIVSGGTTLERIGYTTEFDRRDLFETVVRQIESAPYSGSGYGTFAQSFLTNRDAKLSFYRYAEAHNVYLELAAEIGIIAAAALVMAVAWCVVLCLIGAFRRNRDQMFPIIAVAAAIVVGSHALTDFSLQIPAVAVTFAAILGAGVAQSQSSSKQSR
jgi:O-antigen ligase